MSREGLYLFVEGGGDGLDLRTECRRGFSSLIERAGFRGRMPRVIACGSRSDAYEQFAHACALKRRGGPTPMLLVDSEAPVKRRTPWEHVASRVGDGWARPESASDEDLHFMVECMETWIVADREALRTFFGAGFHEKALPARANLEEVAKVELYRSLESATRACAKKGAYGKGPHSFKLLALVDPDRLRAVCPSAERFFGELRRRVS